VVAKDSGQAANTVSALNLANMIARLPPGSYGRARWLITPDALPSVFTLTLGNYPIWMPPMGSVGGVQANPYGMLLGRPIQVSQHAAAFSAQGDICLADFQYVRAITKAGGIQVATSMHLFFDAGATAFRATFRIDAQPKISKQITQAKGTNKLSPFVMLGAR
jgi:HK97 family phage major capsid protein